MDIPKEVQDELFRANGNERIRLVVEWDEGAALAGAASYPSRDEKLAAMDRILSDAKAPVLEAIRRQPHADVNDLKGTGHALVEATADEWRNFIKDESVRHASIRLLPNVMFDLAAEA